MTIAMRWSVFWVRRQFYIPTAKRPDTGSVATAVISRWYRMVLSRSACQSIASERSRERSGKFLTACEANIFRVRSSSVGEKLVRNAVRRLEVTVHDDERKWGYGWVSCRTWSERGGGGLDYWARWSVGPERIPTSLARSQTRTSRPFRIWAPPGRFWVTAPRPSQACHCQADRMSPRSLWEQKPLNTTRYGSPGYWLVTSPRQMSYIHSMIQECRDVCTKDYGQIIQVTPLSRM